MRDHVSPRAVLGLHPVGFAVETTEGRRTRFCRRACSRAAEPPHSNRMWRDALRYLATASAKGRGATVQSQCSRLGPRTTMINLLTCASAGAFSEVVLGLKPILRRPCNPPLRPFLRQPQQHTSRSRTQPTPSGRPPAGVGVGVERSVRCGRKRDDEEASYDVQSTGSVTRATARRAYALLLLEGVGRGRVGEDAQHEAVGVAEERRRPLLVLCGTTADQCSSIAGHARTASQGQAEHTPRPAVALGIPSARIHAETRYRPTVGGGGGRSDERALRCVALRCVALRCVAGWDGMGAPSAR